MIYKIICSFCLLLTLTISPVKSQNCAGSSGNTNTGYDFGRGPAVRGPAIPDKTNYGFSTVDVPEDGEYSIVKTTAGMSHVRNGAWLIVNNHTPNDPDGYMMLINADEYEAGMFYQETISGLCPGTTYNFGAWIINVMANPGIRPNVKFIIETTSGTLIKEFDTGEIPEGTNTDWKRYSTTFTSDANSTEVVIKILNNGLGGGGNDFALDDITFSPCGPVIIPSINGEEGVSTKRMCIGEDGNFTFIAEATPDVYTNPQYQWQVMDADGLWQDIRDEISTQYIAKFTNAQVGSYKYQLLVAENGNITSLNCRVNSPTFEIYVSPLPDPKVVSSSITICEGYPIHLSVSDASASTISSYEWTGPLGFNSDLQSPVIDNATAEMAGTYKVTLTNETGCVAFTEIEVNVVPGPTAHFAPIDPICERSSVPLEVIVENPGDNPTYRWEPAAGLSATDIPNPLASPAVTTTYTVYVSNGSCETSAQIEVVVLKNATASAGDDKIILEGQQITLQGAVSGDGVTYYWSPVTGLDDFRKLNPIASPKADITYTLNAVSDKCSWALDQVFIKVYQHVIIPSSFSPNGDGINDSWNITAINTYSNPKVKVMNRYGQLVFESKGDQTSWDGKLKNEDVPVGVYYYIINLEPGLKLLSGSLTLIR